MATVMFRSIQHDLTRALWAFLFLIVLHPFSASADVTPLLQKGDQAVLERDFLAAENYFTQALSENPENYRIILSLAGVKAEMKKLEEADQLLDRILAMKVSNGRNVLVFMLGKKEPLEAEVVDETVFPPPKEKDNMRNYLDLKPKAVVPHYRFFFKKSGKMALVPKDKVRVQYVGVLRSFYVSAQELKAKVKKELIARASLEMKPVEMVALKGGCFPMGSVNGDVDEQPVHEVCLAPIKMDKNEVTQKAFQAVMGINPSQFQGGDLPVDSVTWDEADAFCRKSGKRLPTEAEWEYAARGGTSTEYSWGDAPQPDKANFCDSSCDLHIRSPIGTDGFKFTSPVGSYPPNPFGLHDMAGNVSEWTSDWILENYYQISPKDNPKGPDAGRAKVVRGGSWYSGSQGLRSANRSSLWRDYRKDGVGFRCVTDGETRTSK